MTPEVQNRIIELAGGNPGALFLLQHVCTNGGEAVLAKVESLKVIGRYVYMAYSDIFNKDVQAFLDALQDPPALRQRIMVLPEVIWELQQKQSD